MRLAQSLRQTPTVSPQLVVANELLQFSYLELERAIVQELADNPALEMREVRQCQCCGAELDGYACSSCGAPAREGEEPWGRRLDDLYTEHDGWGGPDAADEWDDPIDRVAARTSLGDHLAGQVRLALAPVDVPVALYLLECLDDRGYLKCELGEAATALGATRERVERVLKVVQSLEPPGIAARDARECLLIQIEHLRREDVRDPLAELLIQDHWALLGRCSVSRLARAAGVSNGQACLALRFIRENLNPFPAHAFWASQRDSSAGLGVPGVEPDVVIRESRDADREYDIELPKASRFRLRVATSYREALDGVAGGRSTGDQQDWERWEAYRSRARLFVRSLEQRWHTLYDVADCLVTCQSDFLRRGEARLKPLTRAGVAEMMGVHESTVSRAVAGKYALLPSGRIVQLAKFFDSAAPMKRMIRELVDHETKPLSDQAIADALCERGYEVARRTVAKYRNALKILPSSQRRLSEEG
jgi:RNA polymerase sigma-54 factor